MNHSFAQNTAAPIIKDHVVTEAPANEIFTVVEEMPEFPGGVSEMMKFIQINLNYPLSFRERSIGGKLFLKFVVSDSGYVSEVIVMKGTGFSELDNEAKLVISKMPRWKPGKQNGKTVKVYFTIPIGFGLDTPYFIYNLGNNNPDYIISKSYWQSGNYNKALDALKKIEDQSNIDVLYLEGVLYYMKNKNQDACDCFKRIIDLNTAASSTILLNVKKYQKKYCSN